jgi:hypothetical protein
VLHRLGEPGDDAVDLGQEGFREEGDLHGARGSVSMGWGVRRR